MTGPLRTEVTANGDTVTVWRAGDLMGHGVGKNIGGGTRVLPKVPESPDDIELTDNEADFLTDLCPHPMIVGGRRRHPGGWCLDCDAQFKRLLHERLVAT